MGCGIHSSLINTRWAERSSLPSPSIYITEVVSEKKHSVKSFNWDVLVSVIRSFLPDEYVLVGGCTCESHERLPGRPGTTRKTEDGTLSSSSEKETYNSILFQASRTSRSSIAG